MIDQRTGASFFFQKKTTWQRTSCELESSTKNIICVTISGHRPKTAVLPRLIIWWFQANAKNKSHFLDKYITSPVINICNSIRIVEKTTKKLVNRQEQKKNLWMMTQSTSLHIPYKLNCIYYSYKFRIQLKKIFDWRTDRLRGKTNKTKICGYLSEWKHDILIKFGHLCSY